MYAQQANTGIAPLDAVLATAAMVTPEQTPTVAAQVVQAAQQKMQSQGIMGGMPQATQNFSTAAQIDNMKRIQMQQAMQQMAAQMTARPAGIEGLPAQNMQTFAAAQGGVVGYASRGYVDPQFPEVYETSPEDLYIEQMRENARRKQQEEKAEKERREKLEFLETAGAPQAAQYREPVRTSATVAPIPEGSDRRLSIPAGGIVSPGMTQETPAQRTPRPPAPATRPPAAAPASTGIAAALAERPQYDVASIPTAGAPYMKAGEEDVARLRKAEGERATFEKTLPDLSAKGIEALQQRMRDVEAAEAQRKKNLPIDQSIAWLLGGKEGAGGSARAAQRFEATQNAAADAFSQARLQNQQAQLMLEKAQQDRQLGRFDRAIALEREASALMEKARDNALKAQQIQQGIASAQFQGAVQMRGQDITAQTAAADRATQLQVAKIQAAARSDPASKEALAMARVQAAINGSPALKELAKAAAMGLSGAQERYATEEARLYQRLAPELMGGAETTPALAPPPAGAVREKSKG